MAEEDRGWIIQVIDRSLRRAVPIRNLRVTDVFERLSKLLAGSQIDQRKADALSNTMRVLARNLEQRLDRIDMEASGSSTRSRFSEPREPNPFVLVDDRAEHGSDTYDKGSQGKPEIGTVLEGKEQLDEVSDRRCKGFVRYRTRSKRTVFYIRSG